MSPRVVLQKGHCFRTRGATGTSSHRGTEQQFADALGDRIARILNAAGIETQIVLADPPSYPRCDIFVALHQDGSTNRSARGASVGYPADTHSAGARFAARWKALYQTAGWEPGFRSDNYTRAIRGYYAYRRVTAATKILIEHGFATNVADANWMWDNLDTVAHVDALAIAQHLGLDLNTGDSMPTLIVPANGNHAQAVAEAKNSLQSTRSWVVGVGPMPFETTSVKYWAGALGPENCLFDRNAGTVMQRSIAELRELITSVVRAEVGKVSADVDEDALAAKVAAKIKVPASQPAKIDYEAIATAVADEQYRRQKD